MTANLKSLENELKELTCKIDREENLIYNYFKRAEVLKEMDKFDEALGDYRKSIHEYRIYALKKALFAQRAYISMAEWYIEHGEYEKALDTCKACDREFPYFWVWQNIRCKALAYEKMGDYETACKHYETLVDEFYQYFDDEDLEDVDFDELGVDFSYDDVVEAQDKVYEMGEKLKEAVK